MRRFSIFLVLCVFASAPLSAETLRGEQGMVASRSDIASEVGSKILADGGNAVDAAVATAFALAVVYPSAGNLGGGGFTMVALANGEVYAQDSREKAPAAAHRDMFLDSAGNVDRNLAMNSLQSTGVPGSVDGLLDLLERFGTMTRQQVMAPAIELADKGFVLNADIAGQFQDNLESFRRHPASLAVFSKNGQPYQAGDRWMQPDLARTLVRISDQGRDGFYKGETAQLLVDEMERNGGLITLEDLAAYESVWRDPVHGTYRGHEVWSMPPPSSGGVLLIEMLNMLEAYDLGALGWGTPASTHLMIEAMRRAYADRAEYLGDPDFREVPTAELVSKEYARDRFADFSPMLATDSATIDAGLVPEESLQTTHLSVADRFGNAVSMTTTLNGSYGNRIVVPGAGFLLNNEMDDFSSKPNSPNMYGLIGRDANEIQPGKRMLSSMTPTIVMKDGKTLLITGSPNGSRIINAVLQVVINVVDHGMDGEQAVTSPRIHHQWMPDYVHYEAGALNPETVEALREMGHKGLNAVNYTVGETNSILVRDGVLEGVSDTRVEGGAAGF